MAPQDNSHLSKIDPEFEELLKSLPEPPGAIGGDLVSMRKMLSERKKAFTAAQLKDVTGVDVKDLTVPARDGFEIPVRVYTPEGSKGGAPLIIIFHGGGFCLGGLENEEVLCYEFAKTHGASVVNVDYRLAPENPFPIPVNDGWDVTKWAAANANKIGADPSKGFIVGGISAGGGIAAVVAHLARDEKLSPPLTGSALLIPVVLDPDHIEDKYKPEIKSYEQNKDAPVLNAQSVTTLMDNYKPDNNSHLFNLFAPPIDFAGLPPTWFQVCGLDPLRDEGLLYERLLREEYNTKTNLKVYPGMPHGFWSFFPQMKKSEVFVQDTLKGISWLLEQV